MGKPIDRLHNIFTGSTRVLKMTTVYFEMLRHSKIVKQGDWYEVSFYAKCVREKKQKLTTVIDELNIKPAPDYKGEGMVADERDDNGVEMRPVQEDLKVRDSAGGTLSSNGDESGTGISGPEKESTM